MLPAFVNQAVNNADTNATSIAAAAASHTADNTLLVGIVWGNAGITVGSVTDTALNSYISTGVKVTHGTDFIEWWIAKKIVGNAANVVTANFVGGNAAFRRIVVLQYSGVDVWSPTHVGGTGQVASGTSVTAAAATSTTVANGVQVSIACATAAQTWSAAGHTMRQTALGLDTGVAEKVYTANNTPSVTLTGTTSAALWAATVTLKAQVAETITENWTSGTRDAVKWPSVAGTGSVISNQYALSGLSARVQSASIYTVRDSWLLAQLDLTGMTGTIAARMLLYTSVATNDYFQVFLNATTWFCSERQNAVVVGIEDTGAWDPATEKWWRIIHTTGVGVQFQKSTDGATWTTLKTVAAPTISVAATDGAINFSTSSANTATGNYLIDNINLAPVVIARPPRRKMPQTQAVMRAATWCKKHRGILVPDLWLPLPAGA